MYSSLTQARLQELLSYNPESGIFTWKLSNSNRVTVGSIAGSLRQHGYWYIGIDGKYYGAHRLAVLYITGQFPESVVDHLDRDRANNKWTNLQCTSTAINIRRQDTPKHNTSNCKNVSWSKRANKWLVQISVNYKRINCGYFNDFQEACNAAKIAQDKYNANTGI